MLSTFLREYFVRSPILGLPIVALVIFVVVFTAVVVRTLLGRPSRFDDVAALPLSDGEGEVADVR